MDVKACQRPVEVHLSLQIMRLSFDRNVKGNQEIPLPGASISDLGELFLTVNAEPNDDGDTSIKVCLD